MIVYRVMNFNDVNEILTTNQVKAKPIFYESDNGWGKFKNGNFYNTFNHNQNENLHFFRFAIDAYHYLITESKNSFFCVFNIPEEKLEYGFGYYPNRISPEYTYEKQIDVNDLLFYTSTEIEILKYVFQDLEDAINWYSTIGKACYMCADFGSSITPVCKTKTLGGFINSFNKNPKFLYHIINQCKNINNNFCGEEFIDYCTSLNIAYQHYLDFYEFDESKDIFIRIKSGFDEIQNKFLKKEYTNEEASEVFKHFEKIYKVDNLGTQKLSKSYIKKL